METKRILKSLIQNCVFLHKISKPVQFSSEKELYFKSKCNYAPAPKHHDVLLAEYSQIAVIRKNFDIMLGDIPGIDVEKKIAPALGIIHLGESSKKPEEYDDISGTVYGDGLRCFAPMVLDNGEKKIDAVFLVDTGAPQTFISEKTLRAMNWSYEIDNHVLLKINGVELLVQKSKNHFAEINVLGMDFLLYSKGLLSVRCTPKKKFIKIKLNMKE